MRFSYERGIWWVWNPAERDWDSLARGTRPSHIIRRPHRKPTHEWEVER